MSTTKMTAKKANSHIRGLRTVISAMERLVGSTPKTARKLQALEYAEATLVAQAESGKSGLKAGVASGFVPYAER